MPFSAAWAQHYVINKDYRLITGVTSGTSTEKMRVTSAGLVGIGTAAPQAMLHVSDSSTFGGVIIERNTSIGKSPRIMLVDTLLGDVGTAPAWIVDSQNDAFRIQRKANIGNGASTYMMTVTSASMVGIGTLTPSAALDVVGAGVFSSGMTLGAGLQFGNSSPKGYLVTYSSPTYVILSRDSGNWDDSIRVGKGSLLVYTSASISMAIDGAGNVGIRNGVPQAALHVNGSIVSSPYNAGAGTSIDWSRGNMQYTTASCGAFTFSNMIDGGSYTLAVQGATSATCSFTHTGLTFRLPSGHGATTASTHTVYSFTRMGTTVYVGWMKGS